jgi:hypothetical protein
MDVWLEGTKDCQEAMEACLGMTEASQEQINAKIKSGLEEVKAMDLEANPVETVAAAEHHAVPNEEATVETTGALED